MSEVKIFVIVASMASDEVGCLAIVVAISQADVAVDDADVAVDDADVAVDDAVDACYRL